MVVAERLQGMVVAAEMDAGPLSLPAAVAKLLRSTGAMVAPPAQQGA